MDCTTFKQTEEYIVKNRDKINELKEDLDTITLFSDNGYESNKKIASDINNIMKFFYSKQTKTELKKYKLNDNNRGYNPERHIQFSKRGIGTGYYSGSNMELFYKFFDEDYPMAIVFENEELFNEVYEKLNDNGKTYFKELKNLIKKYELKYKPTKDVFDIESNSLVNLITGTENINKIEMVNERGVVKLYVIDSNEKEDYFRNEYRLFQYGKGYKGIDYANSFDSQIITLIYFDELKKITNDVAKILKVENEKWENFINEFNDLSSKYLLIKAL